MKYIEKVLGDSAEEHAKLLAKQKKEGGSRGKKTQVVFWKPCFFFNPWKKVVYDVKEGMVLGLIFLVEGRQVLCIFLWGWRVKWQSPRIIFSPPVR